MLSILPWQKGSNRERWALEIYGCLGGTLSQCTHQWIGLNVFQYVWNSKNHCICVTYTPEGIWRPLSSVTVPNLPMAPRPQTSSVSTDWSDVEKLSSFSAPIKQLDEPDTTVQNGKVSHVLIGCGRCNAMPLQSFLLPSVMWLSPHTSNSLLGPMVCVVT